MLKKKKKLEYLSGSISSQEPIVQPYLPEAKYKEED